MPTNTAQLVENIIRGQEALIGPVAWAQAGKVTGLKLDVQTHKLEVQGDSRKVLEALVKQYERLFGPASREVCRDAIRSLRAQIPDDVIPAVLR